VNFQILIINLADYHFMFFKLVEIISKNKCVLPVERAFLRLVLLLPAMVFNLTTLSLELKSEEEC
jgi:hypothetical protein